jgi:large subunit ribosomal protein L30
VSIEGNGSMSEAVKITLRKSMIGRPEKHRRTVQSLGLRKLNRTVVLKDTPWVRGMIQKVSHLLEVEEIIDETQ